MFNKLILLFILCLVSCKDKKPQILLLLAHYDDETMIAKTLVELKSKYDIRAIYLTMGEGGSDIRLSKADAQKLGIDGLKKHLIKKRSIEMKRAAKIFGITQFYQVGVQDIPYRVPEIGYSNPKGRPTTDVNLFLKKGSWRYEELKKRVQSIITESNLNPKYLISLSDEFGIIHAHHQVTAKLALDLKFKNRPSAIYGVLEAMWYKISKFKARKRIIINSNRSKNITEGALKGYQEHKSQIVSTWKAKDLNKSPEILYLIKSNSKDSLVSDLKQAKEISFSNEAQWRKFTKQ